MPSGPDDAAPPGSATVVSLGVLLSGTDQGDADTQAAVEVAAEDVNAFLRHVGSGSRLRLTVAGTRYDPATASRCLERMAASGIRFVVGPETSAEADAVRSFAQRTGMILISHGSTAPSLATNGSGMFRLLPDDRHQTQADAALIAADGVRGVVPLWRADVSGADVSAGIRAAAANLGIQPWPGTPFTPGTLGHRTELAELEHQVAQATQQLGAEEVAVFFHGFGTDVPVLTHAAASPTLQGIRWYGSDGTAQSVELVNDPAAAHFAAAARYQATVSAPAPTTLAARLHAQLRARTGRPAHVCALAAYDAVWLATLAALTPGHHDTTSRRLALRSIAARYSGATGPTRLNTFGDRDDATYAVWTVDAAHTTPTWQQTATLRRATGTWTLHPAMPDPARSPARWFPASAPQGTEALAGLAPPGADRRLARPATTDRQRPRST